MPLLVAGALGLSWGVWYVSTAETRERRRSWERFLALEKGVTEDAAERVRRWAPSLKGEIVAVVRLDPDTDEERVVVLAVLPRLARELDYDLESVILDARGQACGGGPLVAEWSVDVGISGERRAEIGAACVLLSPKSSKGAIRAYYALHEGELLLVRAEERGIVRGPLSQNLTNGYWGSRENRLRILSGRNVIEQLALLTWMWASGWGAVLNEAERTELGRLEKSENPWIREAASKHLRR
jgi:hypothetical protein